MRRAVLLITSVLLLIGGRVHARPHPQLTPQAAALVGKGYFLVPEDNLVVPLAPKAKPVPFLQQAPQSLALVAGCDGLFVIDGDLYRLSGASLSLVAARIGELPAASADGALVASIDEKRGLKLTRDGASKLVPYRRQGNWELDRPYVTPDGAHVLYVVRDYTAPLDAYDFVVVNPKTLELDEIHLSKSFVPGPLRQPLSPTQVGLQMMTQETDDSGFTQLVMSDLVVFDFQTKKLSAPPHGVQPGAPSPDNKWSRLEGKMSYSDDKRCGGDQTLVFEKGKADPARYQAGDGTIVSVLDFLPDGSGMIANVLTLRSCKNRGVIIPLKDEAPPSTWKPFALPQHPGRLLGKVLH